MAEPDVTPPVVTPPTTPWYDGKVDAETVGHWQLKGWNVADPALIAVEATKAHRAAEQFIGVPPNQLLRLPKDAADEQGWKSLWTRLGTPDTPAGYDFSTIKNADGTDLEASLLERFRTTAANLKLPKDMATGMVQDFVKQQAEARAESEAATAAAVLAEKSKLAANWGPNMQSNMLVAQNAAKALGISPEVVVALEKNVGYAQTMEMFRNIGSKIGEDTFVSNAFSGAPGGVMTREAAMARMTELKVDSAWTAKFLSGDAAATREFQNLTTIMAGGDDTDMSRRA